MNTKKLVWCIVVLLIIPCALGQDDLWFYRADSILMDMRLSSGFDIISRPGKEIDYIVANFSFFPRQTKSQEIISSEYSPEPKKTGEALIFEWKNPAEKNISISINNRIKTMNSQPKITKKIPFPLKVEDIPPEDKVYTKEAEITDMNSRIIALASDLATGEDDMFKVVDKMAYWVNANIQYNLTTATKEAAQKSSWVLEKREGVCDEITSLFISMLRSVGIPARFVSGIAYTNVETFEDKWGPHGWAEVYFPGYGWVPYDVTFGEYGWVDAGHVLAKVSEDAGRSGSQYAWRAEQDVSLKVKDLKTNVDVIEIGDEKDFDIEIKPYVLRENAGFGSYNLIIADISNLGDYYQSTDLFMAQTSGLESINERRQHIILEPGKQKRAYWIIKVGEGLNPDYIYTLPIAVYTLSNVSGKTEFISASDAPVYSFDDMDSAFKQMKEEEVKTYSRDVRINCSTEKREYYAYEKPDVACMIRNEGNVFLKDLNVCMEEECKEHAIGIGQEKEINLTIHSKKAGMNTAAVTVKNDDVSKAYYLDYTMLDEPRIGITSLEHPGTIRYKENSSVRFTIEKESYSVPEDIIIRFRMADLKKEFRMGNLTGKQEFVIDFKGSDLLDGKNDADIEIYYEDKNNKEYDKKENFSVSLTDLTIFQRIIILLKHLFYAASSIALP